SHLAHDLKTQLGVTEPMRDWFPLSAMNPFSDVVDRLLDPKAEFGSLKCGCHPNCGIGTVLLVHKKTVVATVMSNLGLERALEEEGAKSVRTAVGDRYVVEAMRKGGYNLGGEQSGHLVFLDHASTGDGTVAALQVLAIVLRE